jgi:cytochrome c-type biogenesis protein CcmF
MEVTLKRGQQASFAGYVVRYDGQTIARQSQRLVLIARVGVFRHGQPRGDVHPSLNFYPASGEPIGTPSIKYGAFRDLYATVLGFERDGGSATFRFFLNPGVMWLWVGGGIVALGGLMAAWPGRRRSVVVRPAERGRELAGVG